jgi:uridylate kinase
MSETITDAANTGIQGKESLDTIGILFSLLNATVLTLLSLITVATNVYISTPHA